MDVKYSNRHKILETLQRKFAEKGYNPDFMIFDIRLPFDKLGEGSKLSDEELLKELDYLLKQEEIIRIEEKFSEYYIITQLGTIAFHDKKYLTLGENEFLAREKLKYDLKNAKRIFRTYWWTFGIAIISFLVSLALLILRLFGK